MRYEAGYFRSHDRLDMFFRHWRPDGEPQATLWIVHGIGEHSGRYFPMAEYFVARDIEVYAMDNRGHGRSGGKRGHVDSFQQFLDDLHTFWLRFGPEGDRPVVLFGQSLGALIALHYSAKHAEDLHSLVFAAGAFSLPEKLPSLKLALARLLLRFKPDTTFGNEIDPNCLSSDPDVVKAYLDDPYVHDRISVKLFFELVDRVNAAPEVASQVDRPGLFMHGAEDCLLPQRGTERIYTNWRGEPKELVIWPGMRHDLPNDRGCEQVFAKMTEWILKGTGVQAEQQTSEATA